MPTTELQPAAARTATTEAIAHSIGESCQRALRRLDTLNAERDDVALVQARAFVRRAAALGKAIERGSASSALAAGSGHRSQPVRGVSPQRQRRSADPPSRSPSPAARQPARASGGR